MELAFSGLHQLCSPMLHHLDLLPTRQREALSTVFGLGSGTAPDRFLVGLATLTLFAEVAEQHPLMCVVDDAQWFDRASAQILSFVARRLLVERIAIVCAARTGSGDEVLAGLPELILQGLVVGEARALLLGNVHGFIDEAVLEQIVAESHGNPLALSELPRTWNISELAGGFGLPGGRAVAGKVEQSFTHRLSQLPADTRLLILTAAAEPQGDLVLLHRAAEHLGIGMTASHPAVEAGLVRLGARVEFAHPLVRSAAYHSAASDDRHRVHLALAAATDPETDPDRRAWHRACGTPRTSEEVAAELERSAARAQARGGLAAAAAFMQRSVDLTADASKRGQRGLAAAQASVQAGAFDAALAALATAEAAQLDGFQRARVDLVRAQVAFASGFGSDAPPMLLTAARALEPFDLDLARETYLTAWGAAEMAGPMEGRSALLEISRAARALPPPNGPPRPLDLLLEALACVTTDGPAAAAEALHTALRSLRSIPLDEVLRWGWMATFAATLVWDIENFHAIAARHVQLVRDAGAVSQLPLHLWQLGLLTTWMGDLSGAAALAAEAEGVAMATGSQIAPYTSLRLHALRGREADFVAVLARTSELASEKGQGTSASRGWGAAVLYNGLGRYELAAVAAKRAAEDTVTVRPAMWALPELVEASVRTGDTAAALDAVARLTEMTQPHDTDFARGVEARCQALVSDGPTADDLYRAAIGALSRTRLRPDLARTHLVYGEWLRREGRRTDARDQLRIAFDMLTAIGMDAFAERARRELVATGEKVRRRRDEERHLLTGQEEQIARFAREGLSNSEIGSQLFISARTVEWHLRKVFTKLDIRSRRELRGVLPDDAST
jgi:DNA-binding CsgD family transcriptional regulator